MGVRTIFLKVGLVLFLLVGVAFAEEVPEERIVSVETFTGTSVTHIGVLGEKLGTPMMVDGRVIDSNTKEGDILISVTAVDEKAVDEITFILRARRGMLPEPHDAIKRYRVGESIEVLGGHQAVYHASEEGTSTRKKRVAAIGPFHVASILILIPDN